MDKDLEIDIVHDMVNLDIVYIEDKLPKVHHDDHKEDSI